MDVGLPRREGYRGQFMARYKGPRARVCRRLEFQVSNDLDTGEVTYVKHIPYYAIDSDKGVDRWKTYAEHAISPLYSVIRTQDWLEVYEHFDRVSLRYIGSEFLPSALIVIKGKIGVLDRLTIMHKDQANR